MKQLNKNRFVIYIFGLFLFSLMAEGCHNEKKCGCGHDLNGVYKPRKRYR